jgi:choline dehydrogenase-like flavoprotein
MTDQSSVASQLWDVIIIGTGIGGATVGRSLVALGLSVLFVEKGTSISASNDKTDAESAETRLAQGWWPNPISRRMQDGERRRFFAAVGCAVGGSSIHYAAALERMAPSDFEGLSTPHTLVPAWPVEYSDFEPCYEEAEKMYGVTAESSVSAESRMSTWDRALMDHLRQSGLKPEPLHVAIRYDEKCSECIGRVCPRNCKSDARVACLDYALAQTNCHILEQCEVQTLVADKQSVRAVNATHNGRELTLRAKVVVVSAGALHSPQLLLRSHNECWSQGLANSSDQVGRNLMFHTSDIFALWAPRRFSREAKQRKSISLRDFYLHKGDRLGYVQSMGLEAGRGEIAVYLKDQLRRRGIRNELLLSLLAKVPSHIGAKIFGSAGIFAAMTEDDPNPNNRIQLDPDEPDAATFSYTITEDLRRRANALLQAIKQSVRPWRLLRISPELEMNYGHPCGTCRFGDDPSQNVLNRHCQSHDLANLFVVDASFMPRSGAINPSLTIAANAIRVAPTIAAQVRK